MSRTARKEEQLAFVRERILDAAVATCAKKGIERLTMADIAAAAGYSAPTLYQYFKSKEEILIALFDRVGEGINATMEEPMPATMTFAQRIELLMRRQFGMVVGRQEVPIMFAAMESGGGGIDMTQKLMCSRQEGMAKHMTAIAGWMKRNCAERPGDAPKRDPETLATLYHAIGQALFFRALRVHGRLEAREVDGIVELAMDLFLNGAMGSGSAGSKAKGARRR